jgi:hypothetical protein
VIKPLRGNRYIDTTQAAGNEIAVPQSQNLPSIMDNVDPCYLLMLPAELRLHIHGYVISDPPFSEPLAQYSGLFYSCKQMQAEMKPEIKKRMSKMLASISEHLVAKYRNGNKDLRGEIRIVSAYNHPDWSAEARLGNLLMRSLIKLLYMHLCSISINIICDRAVCVDTVPNCNSRWIAWISLHFVRLGDVHKTKQVKALELDCSNLLHCQARTPQRRYSWGRYLVALHRAVLEDFYEVVTTKNSNEEVSFIRFR